jgi:pimeloyl-ACP methyl ester carboxylesterase
MTKQKKHNTDPLPLRIIRFLFTIINVIAPPIAKRWGFKLFISPFRYPLPQRERLVKADAEHFTFTSNGKKLQTYSWGEGPIVLFAHGWAGRGLQCSEMVKPLLDQGFKVITFDAEAHGKSEGKTTNLILMSEDLRALAAEVGPIHTIIGHSLGGAVGLLAIKHGLKAERIITISTPSVGDGIITEYLRRINGSEAVGKYLRKRVLLLAGQTFDQLTAQETVKSLPLNFPYLIIHDQNDSEAPIYHAEALQASAPAATAHFTKNLGHTRILRDPAVLDLISNFTTAQKQHEAQLV